MKTFELKPTGNSELFRVVDREGDWRFYFHKPSGKYLRAVNAILDEGYAKGTRFYQYLKNISAEEADKKLKAAGDRGDAVHQAINKLLDSGKADRTIKILGEDNKSERSLTNDEWDYLLSFGEFWNRHNAKLISKEQAVYSVGYGYAGTYDVICVLQKNCEVKTCKCDAFIGKTGLLDWKSSGGIYNSYGAQVAAYANAHGVKCDYTGIVRLGTNHKTTGGYEFQPYNQLETSAHFEEFKAAITIANSEHEPFSEAEIKDIPDIIKLNENVVIEVKAQGVETKKVRQTIKKIK